jgi:sodium-dependent dicarboxylate transporter 2/3/5
VGLFDKINIKTKHVKHFGIILGIAAAVFIILFTDFAPDHPDAKIMAAVAVLMSIWWITEAVPLAATSLIPLILFPFLGVVSGKQIAGAYINSTIFLFMGGFIIALAMEKWNLHKRIALNLITIFGKSPSAIILGFMVASAFISMWISNTATAVMILPIGLAILYKLEDQFGPEKTKTFSIALMLGIAYACSVGGIGTIIGTPPNLVFQRVYAITFPGKPEIVFSEWMGFGIPLSIGMLAIVWVLLTKVIYKPGKNILIDKSVIREEKSKLGKMSYEEKAVMIVFIITALLWIFRKELVIGSVTIPGWSNLFSKADFIDDGTVAITMALILFLIPVKSKGSNSISILDSDIIRKIPWEIILLFGGGFALAEGFISSGLSDYIGSQFVALKGVPVYFIIVAICFTITFLTELTSNTATAQIILPILASLAVELNVDPILFMIPATLSASMAFMMPVATPPNAIIFGSQRLKVWEMAKAGIFLNIIGVLIISAYIYFVFV